MNASARRPNLEWNHHAKRKGIIDFSPCARVDPAVSSIAVSACRTAGPIDFKSAFRTSSAIFQHFWRFQRFPTFPCSLMCPRWNLHRKKNGYIYDPPKHLAPLIPPRKVEITTRCRTIKQYGSTRELISSLSQRLWVSSCSVMMSYVLPHYIDVADKVGIGRWFDRPTEFPEKVRA